MIFSENRCTLSGIMLETNGAIGADAECRPRDPWLEARYVAVTPRPRRKAAGTIGMPLGTNGLAIRGRTPAS